MREDLLNELKAEYEEQRSRNEREEAERRERIRRSFPMIEQKVEEREALIFDTIRQILDGNTKPESLKGKMDQLNRDIGHILQENGFPEDFLEPVYRCPKCKDTGYTGELVPEPCECLKKAYQQKVREMIGLGKNGDETFETYDERLIPDEIAGESGVTQRQLSGFARTECERWADGYPEVRKRDILLSGKSGLGKTFLMRAMAARLIERGVNVLMVSAYTFLQMARKSYFDSEDGMKELMEVPVLMLDDVGSEPLMQNITVEQLFYLINERQTKNLSTVISTNLTIKEFRERYTERIASRLTDSRNCEVLILEGRDLRKTIR